MKQVLNPGLANFNTPNFIFPMPKRNQSKFYGRGKRFSFVHNTASLHSIMNKAMKDDSNITFVPDREKNVIPLGMT